MFIQLPVNFFGRSGPARFCRDLAAVVLTLCVASLSMNARAEAVAEGDQVPSDAQMHEQRIATSRGIAGHDQSATGKVVVPDGVTTKPRRTEPADGAKSAASKSGLYSDFEIFDADVTLYFDDDYDGHYYGIDVNFDADTDFVIADVYARLYLSLEGGPWELYYTTEIFTIFSDSGGDDYTVETELYSGYPTAYYDLLIELYDADTGAFVAEFGPRDSIELDELPLEDQQKDGGFIGSTPAPIISHSHGGGGSASALVLALLLLVAVMRHSAIARRSTRTIGAR